jgi:hypothetical protein
MLVILRVGSTVSRSSQPIPDARADDTWSNKGLSSPTTPRARRNMMAAMSRLGRVVMMPRAQVEQGDAEQIAIELLAPHPGEREARQHEAEPGISPASRVSSQ